MEEIFGRSYSRYFGLQVEVAERKSACKFKLENNIARQIGGKPISIKYQGPAKVLVEVANAEQRNRIRTVTAVLDQKYYGKEHASFNGKKALNIFAQCHSRKHGEVPAGFERSILNHRRAKINID